VNNFYTGFEVFTVVVLKSIFFWDMTPCSALHGVISQKKILFNFYTTYLHPVEVYVESMAVNSV
jgi:hypothetical protein